MGPDAPVGLSGLIALAAYAVIRIAEALIRKWKPRAVVDLEERRLLSADERSFRHEVLTELRFVRGELATCQRQHADAVLERVELAEKLEATNRRLTRLTAAASARGIVLDSEVSE